MYEKYIMGEGWTEQTKTTKVVVVVETGIDGHQGLCGNF